MTAKQVKHLHFVRVSESQRRWNDTHLTNENTKELTAPDIKQLLMNRGVKKNKLKGKKLDLINKLKNQHKVQIDDLRSLSIKGLMAELKLRGISTQNATKNVLIGMRMMITFWHNTN